VAMPKLSTSNLGKVFRKGDLVTEALRDVSIGVNAGEFVGVVGASGCGKTTLLRLIDGLIEPTTGTVTVDGQRIDKPGDKIAFVFQQDSLLPWRNVLDNTVFGPEIKGREMAAAG